MSRVAQPTVLGRLQGFPSVVHIAVRHYVDTSFVNWRVTYSLERQEQTVAIKSLEIVKAEPVATILGCFDEVLSRKQIVLGESKRHADNGMGGRGNGGTVQSVGVFWCVVHSLILSLGERIKLVNRPRSHLHKLAQGRDHSRSCGRKLVWIAPAAIAQGEHRRAAPSLKIYRKSSSTLSHGHQREMKLSTQ